MPAGIELSAGIVVGVAKPIDAKFGPYASTAAALADIGPALRYKGLTIGIESGTAVVEYWFRDGTTDPDFVEKVPPLPPISFQTTRYDGDGTTAAFAPPGTLTESDSPSAVFVTINGVTQEPGSDYILVVSTNRVVLSSALATGDKIVITRPILLPSNTTLTAEQLGALTNTSVIDGGSY
jgi:hypothetical protein